MLHEAVMFLGCGLGQRLKPVGVVTGTIVDGPAFHTFGHTVGYLARQRLFVVNGVDEGFIGINRKILIHLGTVEHFACIVLLRTCFRNINRNCFAVGSLFNNFEP